MMTHMATATLPRPEPVNPRSLTAEERAWLGAWSLEAHDALVHGLTDQVGLSRATAWGVAGYLQARYRGEPAAILNNRTRADYRKHLKALAAAGVTPPTPGTRNSHDARYVKFARAA